MNCIVCRADATTEWREYDKPSKWTCKDCYPEDDILTAVTRKFVNSRMPKLIELLLNPCNCEICRVYRAIESAALPNWDF